MSAGPAACRAATTVLDRFNGGNVAAAWAFDSIFGNLAVDRRRDRSAADHVVDDRRGHRALLDAGFAFVDCSATTRRRTTTARRTTMFCSSPQSPIRTAAARSLLRLARPVAVAGCNPDFNVWDVGTRTIWNPVPNLDVGLEVMYTQARDRSMIRARSRSTSRVPAVVRSASTSRRARTCSRSSSASSVTSGHDRLITARIVSEPPAQAGGSALLTRRKTCQGANSPRLISSMLTALISNQAAIC